MKSSRTAGPREPVYEIISILPNKGKLGSIRFLTIWVLHGDNFLVVVKVMKERGEDSPACIQLIITNEVGVVSLEGIQDERFICLRDLEVGESAAVGQIELGNDGLGAQARKLRVHLDVDTLVGLDSHDKFISWDILEDTRCDVLELDSDLRLLLIKSLSCLHDEWDAFPALILNESN